MSVRADQSGVTGAYVDEASLLTVSTEIYLSRTLKGMLRRDFDLLEVADSIAI